MFEVIEIEQQRVSAQLGGDMATHIKTAWAGYWLVDGAVPYGRSISVVSALLLATLTACGGDPLDCGAGTKLVGGTCVLLDGGPSCGAGTQEADGACIGLSADVSGLSADVSRLSADVAGQKADVVGAEVAVGDVLAADVSAGDGATDTALDATTTDANTIDAPPVCTPSCLEVGACGPDGCGGSCGACGKSQPYCVAGRCANTCAASCDGRQCGDNGCGNSCGTCKGATICSSGGKCVPKAWTCSASTYSDGVYCDCACGDFDPDCMYSDRPVKNCPKTGATCDKAGKCIGGATGKWTCAAAAYDDKFICNCGCGIADPDCKDTSRPIQAADPNKPCSTCTTAGLCAACKPQCTDSNGVKLACGPDGCGGLCGDCVAPKAFCAAGICQAKCAKSCVGKDCGQDGCGGTCGTCSVGALCSAGVCAAVPAPLSCKGNCGKTATSGCSCAATCTKLGTCCVDAALYCPTK